VRDSGRFACLLLVLPLAFLGGCTAVSSGAVARPSPSPSISLRIGTGGVAVGPSVAKVEVRDGGFFYQGSGIRPVVNVKVGEIVEWDWLADTAFPHNVTFSSPPLHLDNLDPKASSPHQVTAGGVWQVRFTTTGTYDYVCTFHSANMTGSVVVN
jgi:plastocyanin